MMTFATAEDLIRHYEGHRDLYDLLVGAEGFRLVKLGSYEEVAFVADDRAATIAMELLRKMTGCPTKPQS